MELEYTFITEFLKSNQQLRKGDYIYKHDKSEYPLKGEFDLANLYFITASDVHKLTTINMSDTTKLNVDLNNTSEHWWILRIPSFLRKFIGLE